MFDLSKLRFNNKIGQMKWLGLMAAIWSALVAGSLAWYMHQEQQNTLSEATTAATANIRKDLSFRKWATSHGGVYVPPTEHTPPNPYLKVPDRDVVTTTGKTLTMMNPAYMLRQMQSDFPDDYGTRSHITSLKPLNPNNAADAWETKALHAFEQGSKELLEAQQIDGQPYLRMMLPFIVEQGCLKCHAQQGYKLGDIRGGISTAVPLAPFMAREQEIRNSLILGHGMSWLIGLAGLAWLGASYRRIRRLEIIARSAAAIEESERRFRAVTESANDAIISADSAGNIVSWNPGAERMFGYTEAEIITQPMTLLMPERFRNQHREGLARVVAGGVPRVIGKTVEFTGLRKDGSEFLLEFSLAQWQAAEGQFFTAIIRDITERKRIESDLEVHRTELEMQNEELRQAQIALEESRDQFVDLYEFSPVGYLTLNREEMIDKINLTATALLGVEHNKLLHHRFAPFVATEDRDRWHRHFLDVLQHDGQQRCELALRCGDGSVLHAQLDCLHMKVDGASSVRIALTDITQRKQAEESLKNMAAKYHTMFELSSDAIMLLDEKSFFDCNPATLRMFSCPTRGDFISKHPAEFSPPTQPGGEDSMSLANQRIATAFKNGNNLFEWMHRRLDGTDFPAEVLLTALKLDGKPALQATVRDITERKQAEAKLAEQVDDLRRWHEITSGREKRILVIKHEVNELLAQAGQPPRYPSAELSNVE